MKLTDYEKKHLDSLREYLSECTVLLKKDGCFPLEKAGKIALFGNGARKTLKGGTGSGEVNSRFFITIEEGLKNCGFTITSEKWLNDYDVLYEKERKNFVRRLRSDAKKNKVNPAVAGMGAIMSEPEYELGLNGEGDTALYVLSRICGEGSDRKFVKGDLLLTDSEVRDIKALNEKYEKFMLVLNTGGPVDLSEVSDVKNILILSQLGVETGQVLAEILLGKKVPSGKLTTTWASEKTYPKIGEFGDFHDTRYKEGIYVGYRYFDTENIKPLYPFGYGLSYTDFSIETKSVCVDKTKVKVDAQVSNIGAFQGKEVVQLYISKPSSRLPQAKQELCAFKKTKKLKPNEKELLSLEFDFSLLVSYDEERSSYYLEKGDYILKIGNSSRNVTAIAILRLNKETVLRKVRSCIEKPDFEDLCLDRKEDELKKLEVIEIDPNAFDFETVSYERERKIPDFIRKMNDEDLMTYNMGAFDPKGGFASMIGSASFAVAGAAGESAVSDRYKEIPRLIMADGPAGIRIAPKAFKDEKGVFSLGPAIPETVLEFLPPLAKAFMKLIVRKPKKNAIVYEQYCTAIPIGTAVAQSFNEEFAQVCGDVIGEEMEEFGIQLWLAPALNIHRDVRCGRNFEYYSEDPLVSGKMAAAMTKGVQKHKGCGVTIKHFCCNNQETNRSANNSILSERALREIYLKGFEICIRQAKPAALMTSYNLLNGKHVSQSLQLVEDVLRKEFSYEGLVMTDWTIDHGILDQRAIHPGAYADQVASAGVTLFMPGGKNDFEDLKEGFKNHTVTRRRLEENVTDLYEAAKVLLGK